MVLYSLSLKIKFIYLAKKKVSKAYEKLDSREGKRDNRLARSLEGDKG